MMTPEQRKTIEAVAAWLEIRTRAGFLIDHPVSAADFLATADGCGLLPRLLDGLPPLPEAPPKSFGQPWYAIVEDGRADRVLVQEVDEELARQYPSHILINGCPWLVIERAETESYLVSWHPDGQLYWLARTKGATSPMAWTLSRL